MSNRPATPIARIESRYGRTVPLHSGRAEPLRIGWTDPLRASCLGGGCRSDVCRSGGRSRSGVCSPGGLSRSDPGGLSRSDPGWLNRSGACWGGMGRASIVLRICFVMYNACASKPNPKTLRHRASIERSDGSSRPHNPRASSAGGGSASWPLAGGAFWAV